MRKKAALFLRYLIYFSSILLLAFLAFILGSIMHQNGSYLAPYLYFFAIFSFCLLPLSFFGIKRGYQCAERERQRISAGTDPSIPISTLTPDAYSLALPTTLELQSNFRRLTMMLLTIGFGSGTGQILVRYQRISEQDGNVWVFVFGIIGFVSVLLLLVWLLMFFVAARFTKQHIIVDEQGITIKKFASNTRISWPEVTSFIIYDGGSFAPDVARVELASQDKVLKWYFFKADGESQIMLKPKDMSFDEYYATLEQVHQVIIAKTGVKLYDLRKKRAFDPWNK